MRLPIYDHLSNLEFSVFASPGYVSPYSTPSPPVKMDETTVRLVIGSERKGWSVGEDFLCSRSPYFKALFTGESQEATTKVAYLPDDDSVTFAKILNWMYTGALACSFCSVNAAVSEEERAGVEELHELAWCKLWLLANKVCTSQPFPDLIH